MAITAGLSIPTADLAVGDNAIYTVAVGQRIVVTAITLSNSSGAGPVIAVCKTGGDEISETFVLAQNVSVQVPGAIGQGFDEGEDLTVNVDAVGANARMTYTLYQLPGV